MNTDEPIRGKGALSRSRMSRGGEATEAKMKKKKRKKKEKKEVNIAQAER